MRASRILLVLCVAFMAAGCTCKAKKVGDGDNIPLAGEEGPLKRIHFDFDKSNITDQAAATLRMNAEWLAANPGARVQIEGHCDERGTNEYNMALGSRRAKSAHEYLRSLGVDAGRMSTISYGEELPLDPGSNEEAWAKNRRAEFRVSE